MDYQTNPVKAIRAYCLNCCLENANEVAKCPTERCELYPFRFGKNPYRAKPSEKQIEQARRNAVAYFAKNRPKTPGTEGRDEAGEYKNTSEGAN